VDAPDEPRWRVGAAVRGAVAIVAVLMAWQLGSSAGLLNPDFASSPQRVAMALGDLLSSRDFWTVQLASTAQGFLAGWSIAVVVGVALGLLMGLVGPVRDLLEPLVMGFYATPHIALIPLLIVWFGFGFRYKLVVVFLASIFWVLLNTIGAVREADDNLIRMSQSFGANRLQVIATVIVPGAGSAIATGIRQSMPHGIIGAVIGEMFSSQQGVGYLITTSAQLGLTDRLFALVMLLAVAGAGTNAGLAATHARLERWRG
jgi:NitT/TauT family transport system permease protein